MDDYQSGSFRLWLRKKYTGPYIHENPWETKERFQKEAADIVAYYYQARKTNEVDSKFSPEEWYLSVFDGNPFELLERLSLQELMEMGYADLIYNYDFGGWLEDCNQNPGTLRSEGRTRLPHLSIVPPSLRTARPTAVAG